MISCFGISLGDIGLLLKDTRRFLVYSELKFLTLYRITEKSLALWKS